MRLSEMDPELLTRNQITSLLFDGLEDDGKNGDCILVFGARSLLRVEKAAELYSEKRAPTILVSGSGARWGDEEIPEAVWMRDQLMERGVPSEDILLEIKAENTTENVVASMLVLQQTFGLHAINRLLIVSSPFHMKRCLLTLKTYMPERIEYTLCADNRKVGQRTNWWTDPGEKANVVKEVKSINKYAKLGILRDEEL
ncbi:YdcF family protein [Guptibacillus algicola]|uniref:YdcF family protein n=1 Tax=Guptibacillus algicola TaxID=225844 RepID=UPI001CD27284|nr:YdcF family protein [Alkalihalobacillus algicola]MCA0986892.1 YdcF family protein [Alkalihalobacillus algicola]